MTTETEAAQRAAHKVDARYCSHSCIDDTGWPDIAEVSAIIAAEFAPVVAQAEAENGRLRAALTKLKRHCFKHHQGDDSCNCAEIDAALAAPAPETGEREAYPELLGAIGHLRFVVDQHRKQSLIGCGGDCWCWSAEAVCLAHEAAHERAKALRARASVAGGGEE